MARKLISLLLILSLTAIVLSITTSAFAGPPKPGEADPTGLDLRRELNPNDGRELGVESPVSGARIDADFLVKRWVQSFLIRDILGRFSF